MNASFRWKWLPMALLVLVAAACGGPEARRAKYFDRGKGFYQQADYVKATLELRNALQVDPTYAEAHALLGLSFLNQGEIKKAYGSLSKAVELNAGLLDAQGGLGKLFLAVGEVAKAKEKADLVLAKEPQNATALLVRAGCLASAGQTDEAVKILEQVISASPDLAEAYMVLAQVHAREKRNDDAERALARLIARNPKHAAARLTLARLLEFQGKKEEAETQWKELVALDPDEGKAKVQLAGFYARAKRPAEAEALLTELAKTHAKAPEYRMHLAAFYASQGKEDRMTAVLEEAVKELPAEYDPYEWLARNRLRKGDLGGAAAWLEKALGAVTTPKGLGEGRLFLAQVRQRQGKLEDARSLAEKVLEQAPANVEARLIKGDALAARGDASGAITEYLTAVKKEPNDGRATSSLARAYLLNKQPELAESVLKRALEQNPKMREARLELASLLARQGKVADARGQLTKLLDENPEDRGALAALGDLGLATGDAGSASRDYNRLLALEPKNPFALFRAGVAKRGAGDLKEASAQFERALAANPDFAPALVQLVQLRVQQNDLAGAVERARKQVEASPKNPAYHALLGQLHARAKNPEGARKAFEEGLALDLNSAPCLSGLVTLERSQGTADAAVARYRERASRNPSDAGVLLTLAALLEAKGDLPNAKSAYEKVLAVKPDAAIAANNLAYYLAEGDPSKENLERAAALARGLLERYGREPNIADTAAWVFYRRGEAEKARDLLPVMAGAADRNPIIAYHLGMIYRKLGDNGRAKESLQLALKAKDAFPGRAEAEKALKELG